MKNKALRIILTVISVLLFFASVVLGIVDFATIFTEATDSHFMLFAGIAFVLAALLMIVGNRRQIKANFEKNPVEVMKKSKRNKIVNAVFLPLMIVLTIAMVVLLVLNHKYDDTFVFLKYESVCYIVFAISGICYKLLIETEPMKKKTDDNSVSDSDKKGNNKAE